MKTKLVLWGTNAQDERVLIAMQLRAADNKVDIWTFPEAIASPDFAQQMLNEWRNSAEPNAFPEGAMHIERELTVAESILPDDLKVERGDLVQRAQSEWHFIVLSTKLHESYKSELAEIQDKIAQMVDYSSDAWDSLKGFWNKVQEQVHDRNLFREHADILRDNTNELFDQLKKMRSSMTSEFEENSKSVYSQFNSVLDEIEKKVEQGIQRFPDIFEDLKKAQTQFRDKKLKREHSNDIWNRIDSLFKTVKEKKFGTNAINDSTASERLTRRYEGLIGAIDKMQDSIDRDKEELDYQTKRVNNSQGQLEAQIRQAKIDMILERVKSKQEKLDEMQVTKAEIEGKMSNYKEKEAKEAKKAAEAPKAETKREVKVETVASPVAETETKTEENVAATVAPQAEVVTEPVVEAQIEAPVTPQAEVGAESVVEVQVETPVAPQAEVVAEPVAEVQVETPVAPQAEVVAEPVVVKTVDTTNEMTEIAANANAAIGAVEKVTE